MKQQAQSLQEELKQSEPFASLETEAYISLVRTEALLSQRVDALLKSHGLTPTLYNLLRIVRGGAEAGVPCAIIGERLVTRVPDVTRLVDRAVDAGLVERNRAEADRRVVLLTLTDQGRALLDELQGPLLEVNNAQMTGLSRAELETLIALLGKLRAGA